MIPKVIHYCWFGRGEKNKEIKEYIKTWSKVMPDYEVIEWNEDNYDVYKTRFSKEAYMDKQYAFVSDYARLDILSKYGGIYLDVDMEVLKPFDECLKHKCFLGYESEHGGIASCVIGAEKGTEIINILKSHYESIPFINEAGRKNNRPNTLVIEDILKSVYGCTFNGEQGEVRDIYIYDWHVFHPLSLVTGKLSITEYTLAIHRHTLLWVSFKTRVVKFLRIHIFIPLFGEEAYMEIERRRKR